MQISHRIGLRGRLILLMLTAFSVIFLMIVLHTINHGAEKVSHATEHLLYNVKLIAARQHQIEGQANATLNDLMTHAELRPDAPAKTCTQFLAARTRQEPAFIRISKMLPNGDVDCLAVSDGGPVNVADMLWFKAALKSKEMVISDMLISRIIGKPVIIFARAMRNDAGNVLAIFSLAIDLDWLRQELAKARLPDGAKLAVVDANGMIVMRHPDPEGWIGRSAADTALLRTITEKEEGVVEKTGPDGVLRLHAFTPFLDTVSGRMTLWLSVPKAVVTAPVRHELATALLVATTLLLLTLVIVYWGGNRMLVRPLLTLSRVVTRFGAGDYSVRSGLLYTDDEIGQLARILDEVAESIQSNEQKLVHANRALHVLSAGNRTLLRARGEQALLEEMCRAVVESGDYRMAWIGYAEHDSQQSIRPMAFSGIGQDFFDELKLSWAESAQNQSATARAISQGVPVIVRNVASELAVALLRDLSQRYGIASVLALPLRIKEITIGALVICAAEPEAFDDEEISLLGETADDLAFGIATQRADAEHDRTRAELKSAEERFRQTAEASLDALFILTSVRGEDGAILDFEFTDLNPRAEEMLGMPRDKIIGQKLCELIPVNRTEGFFDKYVAVATTGTPLEEEFSIDTPQIKSKWLRHQVVRVGDGIAISSRDITDWKEAGAEIKRLGKQNTQILDAAGEGIFGLDREGRCAFINPAGAALLGWPAEELIGQMMHPLYHHTRADGTPYSREECPIYAAYRDGVIHRGADEIYWRKDGSSFPVEYVITPMYDEQGELAGAVESFDDISERKANEKALARTIRALKTLSAGNMALVRATDEMALLQTVCHVVVDIGSYRMAWVGYADDNPEKTITPKAWAGIEEDYIDQLNLTWADVERGQGPMSRAIRSGELQVAYDIQTDPGAALWRELEVKQSFSSTIAAPLMVNGTLIGALGIYAKEKDVFDADEIGLLEELAGDLAFGIASLRTKTERDRNAWQHLHHSEILQKSLEQSIQAIADTLEARDPYTAGHERRVSQLAVAIAREMGLPEGKIHGIQLAASIHDLGKIKVPAEILSKPGKITDIEFMLIKTHPQAGYDILKDVEFPWPIAEIVWQHHEKLDGSGYPQGLKDGQILLESRIMTVADVVEAMSSHRPYRAALGIEVALNEIERGRGTAYDPVVCDACLNLFREGKFAFQA